MASEDTPRRIKAARALAGFDSVEDLAKKTSRGLGATTLRKMERGERVAPARELREIAEACGLPYEFFTIDFAALGEARSADGIEERVELLEEQVISLRELVVRGGVERRRAARSQSTRGRSPRSAGEERRRQEGG